MAILTLIGRLLADVEQETSRKNSEITKSHLKFYGQDMYAQSVIKPVLRQRLL